MVTGLLWSIKRADLFFDFSLGERAIVPRKGLTEVKRMIEGVDGSVDIGFSKRVMVVKGEHFLLVLRLIDGDYPNYKNVIPENSIGTVKVKRERLLQGLRRVNLFTSSQSPGVTVYLDSTKMELQASDSNIGSARDFFEAEYSGENFAFLVNVSYLNDALNAVDTDEVTLETHGDGRPIIVRSVPEADCFSLVMPMRK